MLRILLTVTVLFVAACGSERGGESSGVGTLRATIGRAGTVVMLAQNPSMNCDWVKVFNGVDYVALSFLWGSAGDSNYCLAELVKDGKPTSINVYIANGSCERKDICSEREATTPDKVVEAGVDAVRTLQQVCPDCEITVTLGLEDNWSAREACMLAGKLRGSLSLFGFSTPVWRNPVNHYQIGGSADCFDGFELHGYQFEHFPNRKPCRWSNDGADLLLGNRTWSASDLISVSEFKRVAREIPDCSVYAWSAEGNCLTADSSRAPAPHERTCGAMTAEAVTGLNDLLLTLEN